MARAKPRLFRDPIHDIIRLEPDTAEGRLLLALLETPEVQRLRRVRQLALSQLVYHGAEHSRFAHSMGVAHLTGRMLDQLQRSVKIPEDERLVTLAAALLHDVGHGPFSHAIESVTGTRHEHYTAGIIRNPDSAIFAILSDYDASFPDRVATRACGDADDQAPFLGELVSGQLDADRMDYILRDGHMTGVQIGRFDVARILAMLDVADGHLALHSGGQEAIEGYLLARFHMYKQVYLHKTSRAAERMLEAALKRASDLAKRGTPPSYWPGGALCELLTEGQTSWSDYITLDDVDVWQALKRWSAGSGDETLDGLAGGLVHRRLYKPVELPGDDAERARELVEGARSIARVRGFDPAFHVLVDESRDSPYQPFTGVDDGAKSIRLIVGGGDRAARTAFLEDRSELVELLGRLCHQRRFLCVHPALAQQLLRLVTR